jgi:hypothetical protein
VRILNVLLALCLVVAFVLGCKSLATKMNPEVKAKAEKVAKTGRYQVLQVTRDNRHNTEGCECASKVELILNPLDERADQQNLCVGSGASNLSEYDALQKGDVVKFEVSDTLLDIDCSESPSSFLKVKK